MRPVRRMSLPPPRLLLLAMHTAIHHTPLPLLLLLLRQEEVVIAQVAGLVPHLPHLGVSGLGRDGPDALPKPLVALAVLLDTLLDLLLVQAVVRWQAASRGAGPGDRLRCGHVAKGRLRAVDRRRHHGVHVGRFALAQDVVDLGDGLCLEELLGLEALEDLAGMLVDGGSS